MVGFQPRGGIFDVDDTLLDNKPGVAGSGLHERSRIRAIHEAGEKYGITALAELSVEDNLRGFTEAPVHTLEAAVWNIFVMTGLADSAVINPENPLLKEIVARKDELHEAVLLEFGEELPGSTRFVRDFGALATVGNRLAVASTAVRRDIDLYFDMVGLAELFPNERIKSKESITYPKPNPEVFNLAFESLGLSEADRSYVCAFEDDPRGIMAAKAAGLYVCAIASRFSVEVLSGLEVAPDFTASTYEDMRAHFGMV